MSNTVGEVRLYARGVKDDDGKNKSTATSGMVRFTATPELSEGRTLLYEEINDIRSPGGYVIYQGTAPRTYSISAKMVSRTKAEATKTFQYTHLLKSWTVPNSLNDTDAVLGGGVNTPQVLRLYGYGFISKGQLRGVPVVITSLNITYPSNVTYIPTTDTRAYIPIIQSFSIELKEVRNLEELTPENFKIQAYREGTLVYW